MTKRVQVHVGDTLDSIGQRVIGAWHRAERGELTGENAEIHVGFETWDTMVRTLSPKRLELLRHIHQHPAKNIRALASALGRDGSGAARSAGGDCAPGCDDRAAAHRARPARSPGP